MAFMSLNATTLHTRYGAVCCDSVQQFSMSMLEVAWIFSIIPVGAQDVEMHDLGELPI